MGEMGEEAVRVPVYERRVAPAQVPNATVNPGVRESAYGSGVGDAMKQLAQVAIRQQDEVDRMQFALLDAKADAFAGEFYEQEKRNPDYAGTKTRFRDAWTKFSEESLKGVPDHVREKAASLFEVKGVGYDGKFTGLFLEKQSDAAKRTLDDAVSTFVRNRDEAGLVRTVEASGVLTQEQKGDVVRKGRREIQLQTAQAAMRADPYATPDLSKFDVLDESDREQLEDFRLAEQGERERALRKVATKTKNALIADYYESNGTRIWNPKQLDLLRDQGQLDDDTYSDLMAFQINAREAKIREARADARAQQTLALALMTPEEKELWKMQRSGTTETQNKSEITRLGGLLNSDKLTANDLIESRAKGLITGTQEKELRNLMGERSKITDAFYKKGVSDNRTLLENTLKPLQATGYVGIDAYNDILAAYDAITASQRVPREQIDDVVRGLMKKVKIDWSKNSYFFGVFSGVPDKAQEVRDALVDWDKIPIGEESQVVLGMKKTQAQKEAGKLMDRLDGGSSGTASDDGQIPPQGDPNRAKWIREHL